MQGNRSNVNAVLIVALALNALFAATAVSVQAQPETTAGESIAVTDAVVIALESDESVLVKAVQQALADEGFNPRAVDGDWGSASWTALNQWRAANAEKPLSKAATWSFNRLVGVAPPAEGTPQILMDGQHMVVPAKGETRPLRWDTTANAWKAPKDYAFGSNSQGWIRLKTDKDQDLLLVFNGARLSPEGQLVLGNPLGTRRFAASLLSKDGKSLGRASCRIGEAVLLSEVVVPCGFTVTR